jgi:adenylate cyclase
VGAEAGGRRLAAILAADVVGYSRLIGTDEPGTLAKLAALRASVIDPQMAEYGGRVFKTTGDGLLAEFPSAVQALRCAIAIQEEVRGADDALQLRIGLHAADVMVQDGDLFGDGVNVAARLEPLAEPGGICITGRVREDAAGKVTLDVEDLGEPELKNIAQRHRVFRVRLNAPERPALPLPDKPSIAVLPFANMSGDPEQEYFADGMVEEIITGLSRVRSFFVIARNSSFAYKGKSPDVRQVGRELGVRYVLEGSVRKAGNRVRITGQLVEANSGAHIWADRFDGSLEDIFDLQDRVTSSVVTAIEPKIQSAEIERARRKPTESLQAYDLVLQALPHLYHFSREDVEEATRLLRRAIALDPTYAFAAVNLALCEAVPLQQGWLQDTSAIIGEVMQLVGVAVEHGADDPEVLALASHLTANTGANVTAGLRLVRQALALNPDCTTALLTAGQQLAYTGDTDAALVHLKRAAALSPFGKRQRLHVAFAITHFVAGRYEAAVDFTESALAENPNTVVGLRFQAASLALLSRVDEARRVTERLLAITPERVSRVRAFYEIERNNQFRTPGVLDALCEGLRRAGVPE